MGNPSAQHELVCTLMSRYPWLYKRLAEIADVDLGEHDEILAASTVHQMGGRQVAGAAPIEGDGTAHLYRDRKRVAFAQVEVQREYNLDKYATLHAYFGSEVRTARVGGHMFVLSPRHSEAASFHRADVAHAAAWSYRASYLSGKDLEPLAAADRPWQERVLAVALTDFGQGPPSGVRGLLAEAFDSDQTITNLFIRTIMEEDVNLTTWGEVFQPDMLERLRVLPAFREYEARFQAEARAEARADALAQAEKVVEKAQADAEKAQADAEKAQADAKRVVEKAQAEVAEARRAIAEERAQADSKVAKARAEDLVACFIARGDEPSEYALGRISECRDPLVVASWLRRALRGATSAEIFPEPE